MQIHFKKPKREGDPVWVMVRPEAAAEIKKIVNRDVDQEAILAQASLARTIFTVPVRCQDQGTGYDMEYNAVLGIDQVEIIKAVYDADD